jgi:hypothetical protein
MTHHLIAVTFGKLHFERHVSADELPSLVWAWRNISRGRGADADTDLSAAARRFVCNT